MMNRVTCPKCGSEVEGYALGWGHDEQGDYEFGCEVCVTAKPTPDLNEWKIGPSNDGSVEAGLYHTCDDAPVAWFDIEPVSMMMGVITAHRCGEDT